MNDPIVDEVRRVRDAYAARFSYDLDAIFRDIKERERKSGLEFVGGVARHTTANAHSGPSESSHAPAPDSVAPHSVAPTHG